MAWITGIGANVFDTLIMMSDFPREDTKQEVNRIFSSGGGPCATGLVAAAKLGVKASWLGFLADDFGGQFLRNDFIKYGVGTDGIEIISHCSSFSSHVILNAQTGSRTCLLHRGTLPKFRLNDCHRDMIRQSDLLLLDGNELNAAIEAAELARHSETIVLLDAGRKYNGIESLLPLVDYLIPSEEFALDVTGKTSVEHAAQSLFESYHPKAVAITCGTRGGVCFDGSQTISWPAFPVNTVDTNGAGDVFHGAFAWALTEKYSLRRCCLFASATSAIKCTRLGARYGTPLLSDVLHFMKERDTNEL
ncbi:MAG: PfkB family carbohydrate kinase [Planctomycetia bacterium]|nr:PfkB family carbohydrate kinase [Planctomycetia bacterium]